MLKFIKYGLAIMKTSSIIRGINLLQCALMCNITNKIELNCNAFKWESNECHIGIVIDQYELIDSNTSITNSSFVQKGKQSYTFIIKEIKSL